MVACGLLVVRSLFAQQATPAYHSPAAFADAVSRQTTITLRPGPRIDRASVYERSHIDVVGTSSGAHAGRLVLSSDGQTLVFYPDTRFAAGERVDVVLAAGLRGVNAERIETMSFSFIVDSTPDSVIAHARVSAEVSLAQAARFDDGVLAAYDAAVVSETFPVLTVTTNDNPAPGRVYLANLAFDSRIITTPHLMIVDNNAVPVFQKRTGLACFDLKRQPNGTLTYFDGDRKYFVVLDTNYNQIRTVNAGNGYETDVHELLLLDNGHALLMGLAPHRVDMSEFVPGGDTAATVLDMCIQELDPEGNVLFEWRSNDHIAYSDAPHEDLTAATIDHVHPNSLALDHDGNILLSSRHLDEVTKINRSTGAIMWRLGGKHNDFTFVNDPDGFTYQHDARRLDNGNILLYDNGNFHTPRYSRAVEYRLDEVERTATLVWQYRHTPEIFSYAMGNAQRLPNGNTMIGWGANRTITEVRPDGSTAFEMLLPQGVFTYRAFRLPAVTTQVWTELTGPPTDSMRIVDSVELTWKRTGGASSYELQVALDPTFELLVKSVPNVIGTAHTADSLALRTQYYWRVRAIGDDITGVWSETWSFETEGRSVIQTLFAPPNGGTARTTAPVLQWSVFPSAKAYRVQLALADISFSQPVFDTVLVGRYLWMDSIEPSSRYYWRVRPVLDGAEGNWSQNWQFRTASVLSDGPPQSLTPVAPPNESTIGREDVVFKWATDTSFANPSMYRLQVAVDERFETSVLDSVLENTELRVGALLFAGDGFWWRIRATNDSGEQYWSRVASFHVRSLDADRDRERSALQMSIAPNPTSTNVMLHIAVSRSTPIEVRVIDATGREVLPRVDEMLNPGDRTVLLRTSELESGVYLIVVSTSEGARSERMIITR